MRRCARLGILALVSFASWVRETLLLTRARATVARRPATDHEVIRRYWFAARARLRVAERLDPRTEGLAALPLYREGFVALVGAAVVTVEGSVPPSDVANVESAARALERIWPKLHIGSSIATFEAALAILREPRRIDAPPPTKTSVAFASLDRLRRILERHIEPRTAGELRRKGLARVALLIAVPVALVAWLVPPMFRQPSIALHKPIKLSSSHPDSMAPATGEWLVNGRIERTYGAHTNTEDSPWMMVDLEQPVRVKRIVIYNRGDGWFAECLPLSLEVGVNEGSLRTASVRDTVFTQQNPWVVALDEDVRFVRVSKKSHGNFALSEIAVYSR